MHPDAGLMHLLFEVRSRQLAGELLRTMRGAFLSGLVVGQDVSGALRLIGDLRERKCNRIGAPGLCGLYAAALDKRGIAARCLDGNAACLPASPPP